MDRRYMRLWVNENDMLRIGMPPAVAKIVYAGQRTDCSLERTTRSLERMTGSLERMIRSLEKRRF